MVEVLAVVIAVGILLILVLTSFSDKKSRQIELDRWLSFEKFLGTRGYKAIDNFDARLKSVTDSLGMTSSAVYVKHAFVKAANEQEFICHIQTAALLGRGKTDHLIAAIPNSLGSSVWLLLSLPGMTGLSLSAVRKGMELSLSQAGLSKVNSGISAGASSQNDLFVRDETKIPDLNARIFGQLPKCGNVVLRSAGTLLVVEPLSLTRGNSYEDEARELMRVVQLLTGSEN